MGVIRQFYWFYFRVEHELSMLDRGRRRLIKEEKEGELQTWIM